MWRFNSDNIRSDKRSLYSSSQGPSKKAAAWSSNRYSNKKAFTRQISRESNRSSFRKSYSFLESEPNHNLQDGLDLEPPTISDLPLVKGYDFASFSEVTLSPPSTHSSPPNENHNLIASSLPSPSEIGENDARKALLDHVRNHYCYRKGAAKHMLITKMSHSHAYRYSLETFTETRQIVWTFEPHLGRHLDSTAAGEPPDPWDIKVDPPKSFEPHTVQTTVPHTDALKACHGCGGVGRSRCRTCNGTGWETCYSCTGDGYKAHSLMQGDTERCFHCQGNGRRKCWKCNGDGMISCKVCSGTGQIRCYIKLTISWTNHVDDFYIEPNEICRERLKCAVGQVIVTETGEKLWPISHFPNSTITKASTEILNRHQESYFATEKPVLQRQRIYLIPITKVFYSWRGKSNYFWVYGMERAVYAPNYPQKYCFDCNIG